MNLVISLRRLQGFGVVSDRVRSAVGVFLFKDSSGRKIASICDKRKSFPVVRQEEDWRRGKGFLQTSKSLLMVIRPVPGFILLCKIEQWTGKVRIIANETPIEITET